ncbi:UNKNOWN [Stylonychia lemnae]|uniref:Uncharacterized protein n=1 Tax=Stylonychia lemnae TaxID=5949 RepID=A0A078AN53_STYLE|nr:UNKNOWN [Stylonychia lemnae]|eukprot:CDW83594.1 UNKNOWN [Stylonychia lemnae]
MLRIVTAIIKQPRFCFVSVSLIHSRVIGTNIKRQLILRKLIFQLEKQQYIKLHSIHLALDSSREIQILSQIKVQQANLLLVLGNSKIPKELNKQLIPLVKMYQFHKQKN